MTLALPSAPATNSRRQVIVVTTLVVGALTMMMVGMVATWLKFRAGAPTRLSSDGLRTIKDWMPKDIKVPEVAANTMFSTFPVAALMAQWAVYSTKRGDRTHRSIALLIVLGVGIAIVNAQVAVWAQMEVVLAEGAFQTVFWTITGTMLLLVVGGLAFTAVALFRSVGGRDDDHQVVSAHALYWYFLTAVFTVVWFFVYVQK